MAENADGVRAPQTYMCITSEAVEISDPEISSSSVLAATRPRTG